MIVQQINYNMGVAECLLGLCLHVCEVYYCNFLLFFAISQLADIVRGVWMMFAVLTVQCTHYS